MRSIQELVQGRGIVTLKEIQDQLDVSAMTVRRDVARLESLGLVVRTRGGVMNPNQVGLNTTYDERRDLETAGKQAIGEAAATEVEPGDTLFLSGGTTVLALARALPSGTPPPGRPTTVITNSLLALPELIGKPWVTTLSTGGRASLWDRDLVGQLTTGTLARFRARKAFIGATGVAEDGVFSAEPERAAIDRAMVEHAAAAYVLADHTKLGRAALEQVCTLRAISCLVTDTEPQPQLARRLRQSGVRVVVAAPNRRAGAPDA
jgi:DeoR/GlpR family transcriptional regulator of sugar metabolism